MTEMSTPASSGAESSKLDSELPALFRWFPELRGRIAWLPLGRFPTAVEPLLLNAIPSRMFIKRDDLAANPYGGNKVRKLEFILAEARRQRVERLITAGAAGSHHALATAVYGRMLGFQVTLVLFPQRLTPHVREVLLLDHAYGAEIHWVSRMEAVPFGIRAARLAHRGERCMTVAPGGSDPHGALGYVSAGLELAEQITNGLVPEPLSINVAAGTLGTSTGLALGLGLAGRATSLTATRITSRILVNRWALRRLARRTAELLASVGGPGLDVDSALRTLRISHRQIGRGYGVPTRDAERASEVLGEVGVGLDLTYTAKAAVDFLDAAQMSAADSVHLFWHTLSRATPPQPEDAPTADTLPLEVSRYLEQSGS
jgi:1-aminocyclopropane-1-carboxylate deaminase/D-cysteine desulfhydrase-like pyridoxal-dependent ACC family enzyme